MNNKPYKTTFKNLKEMSLHVGKELGLTDWVEIKQSDINTFAKLTEDEQWIHIDKEKSEKYSPYKNTIAHGFMILSFSTKFAYETFAIDSVKMGLNYGLDRVRFLTPVNVGSKVRTKAKLISVDEKEDGRYLVKNEVTMEIEGQEKPAFIAEALTMFVTG